jgi:uncharacterized protein involved in tolerance to divalent cations
MNCFKISVITLGLSLFANSVNAQYCSVTSTNTTTGIGNFSATAGITSINNASTSGTYTDYSTQYVSGLENDEITFSIIPTEAAFFGMGIWVDWNGNYVFDTNEQVYNSGGFVSQGNGTFAIPNGTTPGTYRMRVVANKGEQNPYPCGDLGDINLGEAEDYSVEVLPTCVPSLVNLGNDTAYCATTNFNLMLDAGALATNYTWNDGSTNQTLSVTTAGIYSVLATNGVCYSRDTLQVIENQLPVVNLGIDTAFCKGNTLTLNAGYPGALHLWSDGSMNQTLVVDSSGIYTVTVKDLNGCISSGGIVVTVNNLPSVNLGVDTAICAGTTLVLDAQNAGSTYLWNNDVNETNQQFSVASAGTYFVQVTDANGCKESDAISIGINSLPIVNLGNDTTICSGTSLTVDADNIGSSYIWDNDTNLTSQTLAITTAGAYTVVVTDVNGCKGHDTVNVLVNTSPLVNLGIDTLVCSSSSLVLNAQNTSSTYVWNNDINKTNQTLTVTATNTYSVVVTDTNGCKGYDTIAVTFGKVPTAGNLTYTDKGDCVFDFGVTNAKNISTYYWSFGSGYADTTTTPFTTHAFADGGNHTASVTMTNACGTISKNVTFECSKLGLKETSLAAQLTLYPNPSSTNVTIATQGEVFMESIRVIDNLGKIIYQETPADKTNCQMDVSYLSNGFYTLIIQTNNGEVVKKLEVIK